jgi:hypothetical protein
MNSCDVKSQEFGLKKLTAIERVVHLISYFNFEVELGGIEAFYYNTAGNYACAVVPALRTIGATRTATALAKLNALFSPEGPPRGRVKRYSILNKLIDTKKSAFDGFQRVFANESPDVFSKLCRFIEAHADKLKHHVKPHEKR